MFVCCIIGDVVLTNLRIRSNALDELDLPVQLVYGYIGKSEKETNEELH